MITTDVIHYFQILLNTQNVLHQILEHGDINIGQQKTPRFWRTKTDNLKTVRDLVNNVDGCENTVIAYEDLDLDDTSIVLEPAPYVADKIDSHKEKLWNEFLRLIGIANMNFQKKERNIKDEVLASQGGTIASRYSRFEPRKKAVEEINKKFGDKILLTGEKVLENELEVKYYDGLPNSIEDFENDDLEYDEGGVIDDTIL